MLLVPLVVAVPARAELPVAGCDFNNDGRADLVVGIPRADVGAIVQGGVVEILRGTSSGVGTNPIESLDEDAPGVNGVAEVWDRYGAVVVCGDFNNDGDADMRSDRPTRTGSRSVTPVTFPFFMAMGLGYPPAMTGS